MRFVKFNKLVGISSARSSRDIDPWRPYSRNKCQNYVEVTNSPKQHTRLGHICKVIAFSEFREHKSLGVLQKRPRSLIAVQLRFRVSNGQVKIQVGSSLEKIIFKKAALLFGHPLPSTPLITNPLYPLPDLPCMFSTTAFCLIREKYRGLLASERRCCFAFSP